MNYKQQTQLTSSESTLPFDEELISLINKARENGYCKSKLVQYVKEYWTKTEQKSYTMFENRNEMIFRRKVEKFLDKNFEEFEEYAKGFFVSDGRYSWERLNERFDEQLKREFIYEIGANIYKAFEMPEVDKMELKKITLQRTKLLFPMLKAQATYFETVFERLLSYVDKKVTDNEECKKYVKQFETFTPLDVKVCQFVWYVENSEL